MKETGKVPVLQVGVCSGREISFTLNDSFIAGTTEVSMKGKCVALLSGRKITLSCGEKILDSESPVLLVPENLKSSSFTLHAVTIGVDFHWQRKEDQVFKGSLKLIVEEDKITAVNVLSIEDYLTSVISSEMNATSSEEFLKAHAVISRSWLLAQIEKSRNIGKEGKKYEAHTRTDKEVIRWYDREDHKNYDVCADDHCQRYQGITRASTPAVIKVIGNTFGEVLTFKGAICDTRYYKCCGGMTELFENVWEPVNHPYLQRVIDNPAPPEGYTLEMNDEDSARKWILGKPDSFCNTSDKKILSQVLNDYDQETNDFYRWKVTYTRKELSDLIKTRTGIDFGSIIDLVPLERGVSGRIKRLKIEGTLITMIIGKELEIRKSLSKSHLYSSCFFVERTEDGADVRFTLYGAGWGHGVGLCQIGAAVMGAKGYKYREILEHYFPGSVLKKLY
ncbi:MAG: amidase [Bacteroidetes bacterium RBG_13_44_24]|nr:MAG: amidase [Bacteroidetes bacterium RBG_13_44_24]